MNVSVEMEKVGNARTRAALLRAAEAATGAGIGGIVGYAHGEEVEPDERGVNAVVGALGGATMSTVLAGLLRGGAARRFADPTAYKTSTHNEVKRRAQAFVDSVPLQEQKARRDRLSALVNRAKAAPGKLDSRIQGQRDEAAALRRLMAGYGSGASAMGDAGARAQAAWHAARNTASHVADDVDHMEDLAHRVLFRRVTDLDHAAGTLQRDVPRRRDLMSRAHDAARTRFRDANQAVTLSERMVRNASRFAEDPAAALKKGGLPKDEVDAIRRVGALAEAADRARAARRAGQTFFGFGV